MLRDFDAGTRADQSGASRDVEGVEAPATGADHVEHLAAIDVYVQYLLAHYAHHARDLVDRLALDTQGCEQRTHLRSRGLARHHLFHDGGRFGLGEVVAARHGGNGFADHSSTVLRSMSARPTLLITLLPMLFWNLFTCLFQPAPAWDCPYCLTLMKPATAFISI